MDELPEELREIIFVKYNETVRRRATSLLSLLDHLGLLSSHQLGLGFYSRWLQMRRHFISFSHGGIGMKDLLQDMDDFYKRGIEYNNWLKSRFDVYNRHERVLKNKISPYQEDLDASKKMLVASIIPYADMDYVDIYWEKLKIYANSNGSSDAMRTLVNKLNEGTRLTDQVKLLSAIQRGAIHIISSCLSRLPMLLQSSILDSVLTDDEMRKMTCSQVQNWCLTKIL